MTLSTQIEPISYVKSNATELLVRIAQEQEPIIITQNGEARAVLLDIDRYEEMLMTVNLPQSHAPARLQLVPPHTHAEEVSSQCEVYSIDEAMAELRERRAGLLPVA